MSAPSEYYRKVIEVLLLRQIINQRRVRNMHSPLIFGLDVEAASLKFLEEESEVLMEIAIASDWAVERPVSSFHYLVPKLFLEGDK